MDTGDTAFVLISCALVLLMTPGLGFFYGGMVRSRNVLNTLMLSFMTLAVVGVQWVMIGYTLAFAPGVGPLAGFVGGLDWVGLTGLDPAPNRDYAPTIPHLAFVAFQGMFAIITPALISGSIVERVSFRAYFWFTALWSTVVYAPIAHWVWGSNGWLRGLGALDFAGGTVVHISAGVSALVAALVLGPRLTRGTHVAQGQQVPFVLLGGALLWFGWFGFNAGSALGANATAALAIITTNTAAAAGALGWMLVDGWRNQGKVSVVGGASGAVAGLVAITPAAGFVAPLSAVLIGLTSAVLCHAAVGVMRRRLQIDDTLDAFGVHGVGGIFGALATGVFAHKALNPAGADGLLYGNYGLLGVQLLAVAAVAVYAALGTWLILRALDLVVGLRVKEAVEAAGLDYHHHGEFVVAPAPAGALSGPLAGHS
jgi:Amt family ammonium transporter